jgi:beta-glucosidase
MAHGSAVQAIRAAARRPLRVGWAAVGFPKLPVDASPQTIEAARRATFAVDRRHAWTTAWWTDPVYLGKYPEDGLALYAGEMPPIGPEDLRLIAQPLDFFGINLYWGDRVRADHGGAPVPVPHPVQTAWTAFDWPVLPECLYWGPRFFHERYGLPVVITENGVSGRDWVSLDGQVHDPHRIDFIARHLLALRRAMGEGVPVEGYFHWSILDNFEWSDGYKHRFGLIHVDYETGKRTVKDSGRWYAELIASGGALLPEL